MNSRNPYVPPEIQMLSLGEDIISTSLQDTLPFLPTSGTDTLFEAEI